MLQQRSDVEIIAIWLIYSHKAVNLYYAAKNTHYWPIVFLLADVRVHNRPIRRLHYLKTERYYNLQTKLIYCTGHCFEYYH